MDFSAPGVTGVSEVVVTGPAVPEPLTAIEDLSGREVWVRRSSSYYESLLALNQRLAAAGRTPVRIQPPDEHVEDEDLLEMTNAGLLGITVVDGYLSEFWSGIFKEMRVHARLALRQGGELAWALRKGTQALRAEVDEFLVENRQGTLTGNVVLKKYPGTTQWARNAFGNDDLKRLRALIDLFQKCAERHRFDWLMCAARGYQESELDQTKRPRVGAVGLMQIMPATARDKSVNIPNIERLEPKVHAGIKYLRWVVDTYFADPAIDPKDQMLFAFASCNAAPNRIARLRKEAEAAGLDPDVWFRNVELVVARRVGREPVPYVSNIYKYYVAYRLISEKRQGGQEKRGELSPNGVAHRIRPFDAA